MYTDYCIITPITIDASYGTETVGTAYGTVCRAEIIPEKKSGSAGNMTTSSIDTLVILPPNLDIGLNDKIRITKIGGRAMAFDNKKIAKRFLIGRNASHHWEVYI